MVKKRFFPEKQFYPMFASSFSFLMFYAWWKDLFTGFWWSFVFVLSFGFSVISFAVGVRFLFRKDFRPHIVYGAVLSGGVMGFQTFLIGDWIILSFFGL